MCSLGPKMASIISLRMISRSLSRPPNPPWLWTWPVAQVSRKFKGTFFWDCSGYSFSGLGISISKRTLLLKMEYPWRRWPENYYVCTRAGGRGGLPAKNFPTEHVFCLFRVNRIPFILFILLSGVEWTEWYSVHFENGIAPKRTQIPSIPSIPIPE